MKPRLIVLAGVLCMFSAGCGTAAHTHGHVSDACEGTGLPHIHEGESSDHYAERLQPCLKQSYAADENRARKAGERNAELAHEQEER